MKKIDQDVDDLITYFYGLHAMDVGEAVARWIHSPDCSPSARKLIRLASKVDGSAKEFIENSFKTNPFSCATCCDSGRIAGDADWAPCKCAI